MRHRSRRFDNISEEEVGTEIPIPWQRIQGAIWLVGLAFLLWKGWLFPGILVLLAVSGLFQAGVLFYLKQQEEKQSQTAQVDQLAQERESWLPSVCPACGAPININEVKWEGARSGSCPYCSANLKPTG